MKKSKIIKIALIAAAIMILSSCAGGVTTTQVGDGNVLIVAQKERIHGNESGCKYTIESSGKYIDYFMFSYYDDINKFNVGDTVGLFKATYVYEQ